MRLDHTSHHVLAPGIVSLDILPSPRMKCVVASRPGTPHTTAPLNLSSVGHAPALPEPPFGEPPCWCARSAHANAMPPRRQTHAPPSMSAARTSDGEGTSGSPPALPLHVAHHQVLGSSSCRCRCRSCSQSHRVDRRSWCWSSNKGWSRSHRRTGTRHSCTWTW
jgi:hypothetical protein